MNKNKNQIGFAHFMVITVILVIALMGALGFIFYQNVIGKEMKSLKSTDTNTSKTNKSDNNSTSQSTDDGSTNSSATSSKTSSTPTPDTKNTLKLADWGIKGEYTGNHYITYEILSGNTITFINSTEISDGCTSGVAKIVRLAANDSSLKATMVNGGYVDSGDADSAPKASKAFAVDAYASTHANKRVGDYYYYLASPAQYCSSTNDEKLQKDIFVDIMAYFKSLEVSE